MIDLQDNHRCIVSILARPEVLGLRSRASRAWPLDKDMINVPSCGIWRGNTKLYQCWTLGSEFRLILVGGYIWFTGAP